MKTSNIILVLAIMFLTITMSAQTNIDKNLFLDSLNKYRVEAGMRPYTYASDADTLVFVRNNTVYEHFKNTNYYTFIKNKAHLHAGADSDFVWYNREIIPQDTTLTWNSECAAYISENAFPKEGAEIINKIFTGWKNSQEHWKLMMDPDFQYLALKWTKYEGSVIVHLVIFDKEERPNPTVKKYTREPLQWVARAPRNSN